MQDIIFQYKVKNALAFMRVVDNKYIIQKGSTAVKVHRNSAPNNIINLRKELLDKGVTKDNGEGFYVFIEDYLVYSPTQAAMIIVGGHVNGKFVWRNNGKTFSQIEQELALIK